MKIYSQSQLNILPFPISHFPSSVFHLSSALFLIPLSFFLFTGCPDTVEDPYPPAPPKIVAKSLPEDWVEQGIDADNTGRDRIVLMWHPNQEEDLVGYAIYRADTTLDNEFRKIAIIDLFQTIGADTAYYDDSLSLYVRYFYYITALDAAENESKSSDTVSYRLLNSPAPNYPVNEIVAKEFIFEWMDRSTHMDYYTNQYLIRLDDTSDLSNIETIWICWFYNIWYGWENQRLIPFPYFPASTDIDAWPENVISCFSTVDTLNTGPYRWKVKAIHSVDNLTQIDQDGGESEWAFFSIQ